MKKIVPVLFACFISSFIMAQDVRLNDSVIFVNDQPVALYAKWLSNTTPRYDMEVYSFTDYVLIKAEVLKFSAPVSELKPFYYYELSFPPTADTFSVYIEDEAFPLVLAKLIRDYKLIVNGQLSKKGVDRLIKEYKGGPALMAKIKKVQDYLDETRNFSEQVVRDRTRPVVIVNNKTIMQDNIKIGMITNSGTNVTVLEPSQRMHYAPTSDELSKKIADEFTIRLLNQQVANRYRDFFNSPLRKKDKGYELYRISLPKDMITGSVEDHLLQRVCFLIEDYAL